MKDGTIGRNAVLCLSKYLCNSVPSGQTAPGVAARYVVRPPRATGRSEGGLTTRCSRVSKVVIIMEMRVLASDVAQRIGTPMYLQQTDGQIAPPTAASAAPAVVPVAAPPVAPVPAPSTYQPVRPQQQQHQQHQQPSAASAASAYAANRFAARPAPTAGRDSMLLDVVPRSVGPTVRGLERARGGADSARIVRADAATPTPTTVIMRRTRPRAASKRCASSPSRASTRTRTGGSSRRAFLPSRRCGTSPTSAARASCSALTWSTTRCVVGRTTVVVGGGIRISPDGTAGWGGRRSPQGEIRATAFGETVDRFFDLIQVGQVYTMTRGSLKPAKPQFSSIRNDFEISLDSQTQISLVCTGVGSSAASTRTQTDTHTCPSDENPGCGARMCAGGRHGPTANPLQVHPDCANQGLWQERQRR
jgi:hypothetical protein